MKILYGITKSNFGGGQRYVLDLATEAQRAGHRVSVLCGGEGPLVEKLRERNIRVITLPYLQRDISLIDEFKSLHFIFRVLVEENPDVFHTNSSKMGGLGNLAARLAGVKKIIFTGHSWEFNAPRPWWQKVVIKVFTWLVIFLSHKTICVSEKNKRDIKNYPLIQNKLVTIHNGIPELTLKTREEARQELGIGNSQKLLAGSIAELHPVKGLDILLEAFERFSKKHEASLLIIGDGDLKESLKDYASHLGISEKVIFKGYVEKAWEYLKAFDIYVMPSRSEGLPYALLEAGFAERPVIASKVGGIPEIVENGLNGTLVPPEDSETLFSTLLLLAEDKSLRDRLGSALKETIKEKFSLEKMVRETLALY